jgi:hypothetical protein
MAAFGGRNPEANQLGELAPSGLRENISTLVPCKTNQSGGVGMGREVSRVSSLSVRGLPGQHLTALAFSPVPALSCQEARAYMP